MIARDGRTVWVSEKASVVKDPISGTTYWLGVMVDITDRKATRGGAGRQRTAVPLDLRCRRDRGDDSGARRAHPGGESDP